jgi:hypothetical protein
MRKQVQSQIGISCVDWRRLEVSNLGADSAYVDTADLVDVNRGFESGNLYWLSAKSGFWVPRVQQGVAAEGGKAESTSRS